MSKRQSEVATAQVTLRWPPRVIRAVKHCAWVEGIKISEAALLFMREPGRLESHLRAVDELEAQKDPGGNSQGNTNQV